MDNALVRKLEGYASLGAEDKRLLNSVVQEIREVGAHTDLAREGEKPTSVHLILEGFACRYKFTAEGNRQIMAYLLPGDFCDLHVFVLKQMDHSIATISKCLVVDIPRERILKLLERPKVSLALWCAALVDAAVLREWLVKCSDRVYLSSLAAGRKSQRARRHGLTRRPRNKISRKISRGEPAGQGQSGIQ